MTLPEVYRQFEYWQHNPPEHEMLAMLARVFTTWKPEAASDGTAESEAAHRASLEARWNAGVMNAAQMLERFKQTGGRVEGVGPAAG